MRALLPSVWLMGAALCAVSILSLTKPFPERWPAPPPVAETVVAKTPLAVARAFGPDGELLLPVLFRPAAKNRGDDRDEWVQIAGYTTMVRSRPSAEAAPLSAYPAGRPLRVITREAGFVRVQDLGSGQLGWVEASALAPFNGGYRQRENVVAAPQIAALAKPTRPAAEVKAVPVAETQVAAATERQIVTKPLLSAAIAKKLRSPKNDAAGKAKDENVAAGPQRGGLFGLRRGAVQRVALDNQDSGFVGMVDRAIRGF